MMPSAKQLSRMRQRKKRKAENRVANAMERTLLRSHHPDDGILFMHTATHSKNFKPDGSANLKLGDQKLNWEFYHGLHT